MNTRQEQLLFELEQQIVNSHLVSELQEKLKNNPENLSLLEKSFLFLATHQTDNALELKKEIEQYGHDEINADENLTKQHPSFGAFSSFSPEMFQHLESFLSKNDLYSLRMTSKPIKIWVDDYLARFDLIKNITESPLNEAIALIKNFRTSEQYKNLEQSQSDDQTSMNDKDIIVYALTTNDITKINFTKLDTAIAHLTEQAETILDAAKLNSINNLIKSLTITSLAGKRSLLKATVLKLSDQNKELKDENASRRLLEKLVTQLINQKPDFYSNLLLSNDDCDFWMNESYKNCGLYTPAGEFIFSDFPLEQFPNLRRFFSSILKFDILLRNDLEYRGFGKFNNDYSNFIFCNLAGSCLNGLNLSGFSYRSNFENADLRNTNLAHCDLTQTYLKNADLAGVNLGYSRFGSNLLSANIQKANLFDFFTLRFGKHYGYENEYRVEQLKEIYSMLNDKNNNGQYVGKLLAQIFIDQSLQYRNGDVNTINWILEIIYFLKKIELFKNEKQKSLLHSTVFSKAKTESSGYDVLKIYESELKQQLKKLKEAEKKQSHQNSRWWF